MSLKAGYYGVKKFVLDKINAMADALIIKSLGEGLTLTDGELDIAEVPSQSVIDLIGTSTGDTTIELSEDLTVYDLIGIVLKVTSSADTHSSMMNIIKSSDIPVYISDSNVNDHILLMMWTNTGCSMAYDNVNNAIKIWSLNGSFYIDKVYGIKL